MAFKKYSFLDDFKLPEITQNTVKDHLIKVGKSEVIAERKTFAALPFEAQVESITEQVMKTLGLYKDFVRVIDTDEEFIEYIDLACKKGVIAIDTETNNSLDPLTCKIVGLCLYIPDTRPVYVPLYHVKGKSDELLDKLVSFECAKTQMQRLMNTKNIFHNAVFDIRVIYNSFGYYLPIYWDTLIGAQILDENDLAKLKWQYKHKIDPLANVYEIEKLFEGVGYARISPYVFALYAAIDSYDTYKLYLYQKKAFELPGNERWYKLLTDIEFRVIEVVASMEDIGISYCPEFFESAKKKYLTRREQHRVEMDNFLKPFETKVKYYQQNGKLDNPINYDSPEQLSIVLYKIFGFESSEDYGEKAGKDALSLIKHPFVDSLLEYKRYATLIKLFMDPFPDFINPKDNKIHARFNQLGKEEKNVRTGRFSSSNPNLQQVSGKGEDMTLRMLFTASPGYVIVGGDYSQQEPRLMAHISGDEKLNQIYAEGKDLYASVGSEVFHKTYWECMEHWEDGTPNPEGKARRKKCKTLILGIMYGMGPKLMSGRMGISMDECKEILKNFFESFKGVEAFIKGNAERAVKYEYVEDYMGRRRHLPDINLNEVDVTAYDKVYPDNSVFIDKINPDYDMVKVKNPAKTRHWEQLFKDKYSRGYEQKCAFKNLAEKSDVVVRDNGAFISQTHTQTTNATIQGCLDYDSLICTSNGIQKIGDLSNKNITVWDGGDWSTATVLPSGKKQKCILTTSIGTKIVCSPDHRFLTINTNGNESFKKFSELNGTEHIVYIPKFRNIIDTATKQFTQTHRRIVGIKSIEITDEWVDMYDVCDTERGYFVVNGIVTHNSASSLTKKAMINIYNSPKLRELGFRVLIPVHDELLGECPKENAEECAKELAKVMIDAALPECTVKMKVDTYVVHHWLADDSSHMIKDEYDSLVKGKPDKGILPMPPEDAFKMVANKHMEIPEYDIKLICDGEFNETGELHFDKVSAETKI